MCESVTLLEIVEAFQSTGEMNNISYTRSWIRSGQKLASYAAPVFLCYQRWVWSMSGRGYGFGVYYTSRSYNVVWLKGGTGLNLERKEGEKR